MQQQPSSIPTPEPNKLMTIKETMLKLRVGRSKLYRMIKNEGLPVFRSERYVRIPSDLLDQWIRERVKQNGDERRTMNARRFFLHSRGVEVEISTPALFPVASLITGTTPRGGGIWKWVLHAHPHGLLRQQRPIMTQALHFLDFSIRPKWLAFCRMAGK